MVRDASRAKARDKGKADKKGASKAAKARAGRWEVPAQDSVTEPTVEAIATQILAAETPAVYTTILIREITHRAAARPFSLTTLPFRPSALMMTACVT